MSKWLTLRQASELLGISERTLQRQISDKKLRSRKVKGKRFVIVESDKNTTETTTSPTNDVAPPPLQWQPPAGYLLIDKDTMDTLKTALKNNNEQIKTMLERQREQNILLNNLQSQVKQLMPGNSDTTDDMTTPSNVATDVGQVSVSKDKTKGDKATTNVSKHQPTKKVVPTSHTEPSPEATEAPKTKEPWYNRPIWLWGKK